MKLSRNGLTTKQFIALKSLSNGIGIGRMDVWRQLEKRGFVERHAEDQYAYVITEQGREAIAGGRP
ncbi:MAG TPA: hypothetical protein VMU24_02355 [Candidatus Acidoferrales bacterium]|nr:hypothetical protein [Candidatus Acidoferrales bacterium]